MASGFWSTGSGGVGDGEGGGEVKGKSAVETPYL